MKSDVQLELISCGEAVDMLRQNIRGGLSFVNHRLVELDWEVGKEPNTFTTKWKGENSDILYVDANNLYG